MPLVNDQSLPSAKYARGGTGIALATARTKSRAQPRPERERHQLRPFPGSDVTLRGAATAGTCASDQAALLLRLSYIENAPSR